LARFGAVLAACVVVLGAWVRLTDAGLGCPDWPGCYGHLYPDATPHFSKALHEMVHRYFASSLGLVILILAVLAWLNRRDRDQPVVPAVLLVVLVCVQGALGAFTVTLLLKPLIVTAHLLGGLTTFGVLLWLSLAPDTRPLAAAEVSLRAFALLGLLFLIAQIALGGWTSSNYAAVACPDFPTCQRTFWPAMDFRDAFVLWRGVPIDYEGGVLANPARIAIHVTHRIGALITGVTLLCLGITVLARARRPRLRLAGGLIVCGVFLQISLGIATVRFGVPLAVATLHNAGAAFLVMSMATLLRALWPAQNPGMVPLRS
jgi:cytochrome c oxidase assembly protein subunit 15